MTAYDRLDLEELAARTRQVYQANFHDQPVRGTDRKRWYWPW